MKKIIVALLSAFSCAFVFSQGALKSLEKDAYGLGDFPKTTILAMIRTMTKDKFLARRYRIHHRLFWALRLSLTKCAS